MTDQNIINWDQDADGIVVLTINDPNQGANTMNDAYIASMKATVDRLVAEKDSITGAVITSGKKTFFAGGDLKNMIKVGPPSRPRRSTTTASRSRQTCVASKLSASRSSPPSTARHSAAASRSLSRPTTASRQTSRESRSACPRSPSACCPAAAASCVPCGCSACRTRSWASCSRGSSVDPFSQGSRPHRRGRRLGRGAGSGCEGMDQGQPPRRRRSAVGCQGLQDPWRNSVHSGIRCQPSGVPREPA